MTALRLGGRYKRIEGRAFATIAPILFIYAAHDPIADESSLYYESACKRSQVNFDCRFIDGANHSFFHYKWKEQIFDLSGQWLKSISMQAVS
jgi:dienelactone hydrolase